MNGVLVVDKPSGPTSHDVVARVRRALGISRIGHTGTLDPLATGVLPLVVGRATRLAQFFSGSDKEYLANVRLGAVSDTYDALGRLDDYRFDRDDVRLVALNSEEGLEAILQEFRGTYWQTPPPFSAKKVAGTPAYSLARRNKPVALRPVSVTVTRLQLVARYETLLRLRVVASAGFYVRTLAHEIGQRLGCGGYLEELRRLRAGDFSVDAAVPLDQVEAEGNGAIRHLRPMSGLLEVLPAVVVNDRGAKRACHGNALGPDDLSSHPSQPGGPGARVRVLDADGALIAVAEPGPGGLLQPVVVLV